MHFNLAGHQTRIKGKKYQAILSAVVLKNLFVELAEAACAHCVLGLGGTNTI